MNNSIAEFIIVGFVTREHDWFTVDLPDYLFPPPGANDTKFVDDTVIAEVCAVSLLYNKILSSQLDPLVVN